MCTPTSVHSLHLCSSSLSFVAILQIIILASSSSVRAKCLRYCGQLANSSKVGLDPVDEVANTGVDTSGVGASAAVAPGDNTLQAR